MKRMRRTIEIETSQWSDSPTKRWVGDCVVEDVVVEYPVRLDKLDDGVLLDMADNQRCRVIYVNSADEKT